MNPLELPLGRVGLVGPPQCGALFVARAIVAANPDAKIVLKDFSTRPTVANRAELLALTCKEGEALLIVLHSGASGREVPDPALFDELWRIKPGWAPFRDDRMRSDLDGSEVELLRPGHEPIMLRSDVSQKFEVHHD
jgi:hypothetical protein